MRRLCSIAGGRSRTYAERFPSLLDPLPGLRSPPALHDEDPPPHTEVTTLPNGVRIASQDIPGPMCCVGVTVAAGSVHETPSSAGAAHVLERLAFHETRSRGLGEIARGVEAAGATLGAAAGRERMFYRCGALRAGLPLAVEVLLDCVRNPAFLRNQVRCKVAEAREELSFLEGNPELFLRESLHRVGYSGALGNPLFPTKEALARINRGAICNFYFENYTADRLVLAASGVNHQHLVDIASPLLSDLPKGSPVHKPKSAYTGGDFRHKTDSEVTHVAMAFEVPGGWHQAQSAVIMKVMQTLMGGGVSYSSGGPGKGMQSRLYLLVMMEYDWMQAISAFSSVYDDTGLFGIHLAAPSDRVAEAVDIAIKELTAIARPGEVTEAELKRAKKSTVSSGLRNLESKKSHTEDIGRQILIDTSGKASQHFLEHIDEVTLDDITSVAQKMLSSCPTMASWGDVDKVPTHEYVCKRIESPPSDLMWALKSLFS
ncbi:mitochondrial-processing peptidase subunit alpha [Lolium perenne]|uniref:mitochondrial-processing peptidase subunit alpha n=1 Tax=Lolium perenne TaxID=4522 RepID=UPI0021F58240|nr:mitochondrial-processing peptidase subunit alpha-like [Lolium perenne]